MAKKIAQYVYYDISRNKISIQLYNTNKYSLSDQLLLYQNQMLVQFFFYIRYEEYL